MKGNYTLGIIDKKRGPVAALIVGLLIVCTIAAALILALGKLNTEATGKAEHLLASDRTANFPKIILWAWERPEEMGFIDPRQVGVAYLARTIYLRDDAVVARPRLQPLSLPPEAFRIAVVRVESDRFHPATLSAAQRERAASAIVDMSGNTNVAAIQVDFDARLSERDFYRDLLIDLRRRLPDAIKLSITALASWCIYDDWLSTLPIDEAVPMLFRMGADNHQIRLHLDRGADFRPAVSRKSLGISTDEPVKNLPRGRRVYIFHPRAWTQDAARKIIEEVKQWQ